MTIGAEVLLRCCHPWKVADGCSGHEADPGEVFCRHARRVHGDGSDALLRCESPLVRQCTLAVLLTEMEGARNEVRRQEGWREVTAFNRGDCPKCGRPLAVMSEKPWASFNGKMRGVEQRVSCPTWEGGCGEINYHERIVVQEKGKP